MIKVDAKRMAWYLDLQRILRFPRHFMAPVAAPRLRRKPAIGVPDSTTRGISSYQNGPNTSTRPGHIALAAFMPPKRAVASMVGLPGTKSQRLPTTAGSDFPSNPLGGRAPRSPVRVMRGDQAVQTYTTANGAARGRFSTSGAGYRSFGPSGDRTAGSGTSISLAPAHIPSRSGEFSERDFNQISNHTTAETGGTLGRPNHLLRSEQPLWNRGPAHQDQWLSNDQDRAANSDQPRQNRSAISTIHLDGSVLGRWAIQYLERALGKPTTGMTGVDPRATIPRTRVAPF
jgi:hypothetical protein